MRSDHLSATILELTLYHTMLALSCMVRATSSFEYITSCPNELTEE